MLTTIPSIEIAEECAGLGSSFWTLASEMAAKEGTPFYVYLPHRASAAYDHLASSTTYWGRSQIAFSLKTNPLFALLQDLNQRDAFVEVVSNWELSYALAVGFPPQKIVFNGPLKTEADLRTVCEHPPFTINIDSLDELDAIERVAHSGIQVPVGLRICPPKENGAWSRFGIGLLTGELEEGIARILRSSSLILKCIHFHLGTQIYETRRYIDTIKIVKELWVGHALNNDVWLDIGGGFPYDHATSLEEQAFSPFDFFKSLADAWGSSPRPPLLAEPGRFISAPAVAVVSRVLACKPRPEEPTIVVLDSGTNHNVMAAFYEHLWYYTDLGVGASHRFCGPLCMEDDTLSGERLGPPPKTGGLVATFNAGAYSLALSRTFIQPRPPVFALYSDGSHRLLHPRETPSHSYLFEKPTTRLQNDSKSSTETKQ